MSPSRDKSVARPKRRKIYEYISKSRSRAEVIPGEFTSVGPLSPEILIYLTISILINSDMSKLEFTTGRNYQYNRDPILSLVLLH